MTKINIFAILGAMVVAGLLMTSGIKPEAIKADFVGKIDQRSALIDEMTK